MIRTVKKNWLALLVGAIALMGIAGYNLSSLLNALGDFLSPTGTVDKKNPSGATIDQTGAEVIAERLYDAMASIGTNEKAVFAAFDLMKNRSDFNAVYNAFGKRQYSRTWGNVGDPVSSSRYDLIQWLMYELNESERGELVRKNPQLQIF